MNIIVDAMGGDYAPEAVVKGCVSAAKDFDINLTFVGVKEKIQAVLQNCNYEREKITVVHTSEVIDGDDDPTVAIRQKKDSSMRVGLKMLAGGEGDAFVCAGNTGALIAGATLIVKRIKGIRRVALAPIMPSETGCFLLVDAGANAECTPSFLKQFAIMGSIYMEKIMGIRNPRVSLVNIGSEEAKGTPLVVDTHKALKEVPFHYCGYIEARDIPKGDADVVVCDGFTGNVILKFMEGMGMVFYDMLKEIFYKNIVTKLSAVAVKGGLKKLKKTMDYTEYGGAPLLGVSKPVVKAHGSSNEKAFYHAIRQAVMCVKSNLVDEITDNIQKYGDDPRKETR